MERALLRDGPRDGEIRQVDDGARFIVVRPPRRPGVHVYQRTPERVYEGDDSDTVIFRHRPELGRDRWPPAGDPSDAWPHSTVGLLRSARTRRERTAIPAIHGAAER